MSALKPFPTIGILGGGQLGRMTALAAMRMGFDVKTLSPSPSGPVECLGEALVGDWNDEDVMRAFVRDCDVITVESEWAPAELAETVAGGAPPVWPSSTTLRAIRHKGRQKALLAASGLPMGKYALCKTESDAKEALSRLGPRVVLKRFEGSYDGYGNATVESPEEMRRAWASLSGPDGLLVEAFVPFVKELAVLVARSPLGEHVVYPVVDTEQRDHRCHAVTVPAQISSVTEKAARDIAVRAADAVTSVGILGVELFELENGDLFLNELAPRPHNTGHYTIEACHTSQFENHVRAILGLPLGNPSLRVAAAAMVNIIGQRNGAASFTGLGDSLSCSESAIHVYGKKETRPKRKMGHVTVTGDDVSSARKQAEAAADHINI